MNRVGLFLIAFTACLLTFSQAYAQSLSIFDGAWGGNTKIEVGEGKLESSRCTSTNSIAGNRLSLKIRCAHAGTPHFDVRATIIEDGGAISGSWEERVYGQRGTVSGKLSGSILNAEVRSANFSARVNVQRSGNTLNVSVAPSEKRGRISVAMHR